MHMITVKVICVLYAEQAVPGPTLLRLGNYAGECGAWCTVLKSTRQM